MKLIHIGDATMAALCRAGCAKAGLLGTRYTLESDWLHDRLHKNNIIGLQPPRGDLDNLHEFIMHELNDIACVNDVPSEILGLYRSMLVSFKEQGATGVVLGCTELRVLAEADALESESPAQGLPLFDTAQLHALAAV